MNKVSETLPSKLGPIPMCLAFSEKLVVTKSLLPHPNDFLKGPGSLEFYETSCDYLSPWISLKVLDFVKDV